MDARWDGRDLTAVTSRSRIAAGGGPVGHNQVMAAPSRSVLATRRSALHLLALAVALVVITLLFPRLVGSSWGAIRATLASVGPWVLAGLTLLWAAGRVAHTVTLVAGLPGLTHRRALLLSLTGACVSDVLPVGGVAGVALNLRMCRAWGHSMADFVDYTVVTNVWDVLGKIFLPVLLLPLAFAGATDGEAVRRLALSALLLPAVGAVLVWVVFSPALMAGVVRLLGGGGRVVRIAAALEDARARSARLGRQRWRPLSLGVVLYTGGLFLLLAWCLHATGASVPIGAVVLGFSAERVITVLAITPGGLGFVELGLAGVLMLAPGASGVGVAAGVLLYRLFTFGLEIPLGAVLLGAWEWRRAGL